MPKTRNDSCYADVVGKPEDLPLADLPTRRNVLQKMLFEKLNSPVDDDPPLCCIALTNPTPQLLKKDYNLRVNPIVELR